MSAPLSSADVQAMIAEALGDVNARIRQLQGLGPRPLFSANRTVAQAVAGGYARTTMVFNNVFANQGACYNAATGVFTAPQAGWYRLIAAMTILAGTGGGDRVLATFTKTGAVELERLYDGPTTPLPAQGNIGGGAGALLVLAAKGDQFWMTGSCAQAAGTAAGTFQAEYAGAP